MAAESIREPVEQRALLYEDDRVRSERVTDADQTVVTLKIKASEDFGSGRPRAVEKQYITLHDRFNTATVFTRGVEGGRKTSDATLSYEVSKDSALSYISNTTALQLMRMADVLIASETANKHLLLYGPTSTGKTSLAVTLAYLADKPLVEFNFNEDTTASSMYWRETVRTDDQGKRVTMRIPSVLVEAMKQGTWFLGNEINTVEQDLMSVIMQAIDTGELILSGGQRGNEKIKVHPDFRFIGTMNQDYQGTVELNKAFERRLTLMELKPLPWEEVKEIVGRKFFGRQTESKPHYQEIVRIMADEFFLLLQKNISDKAGQLAIVLPIENFFTIRKLEDYLRIWTGTDLGLEEISQVFLDDLLESIKAKNYRADIEIVIDDFLNEDIGRGKKRKDQFTQWDRAKNKVIEDEIKALKPWTTINRAATHGVALTKEDLADLHIILPTRPKAVENQRFKPKDQIIVLPDTDKTYLVYTQAFSKAGRFAGQGRFAVYQLIENKEQIASSLKDGGVDSEVLDKGLDFYLLNQTKFLSAYIDFLFTKPEGVDLIGFIKDRLPSGDLNKFLESLGDEDKQTQVLSQLCRASAKKVAGEEKKLVIQELESKYGIDVMHPPETKPEDLRIMEILTKSTYLNLRKIMSILASGNFLLLTGSSGLGKSSLVRTAAYMCNQPLVEFSTTGEDSWRTLGEAQRIDSQGMSVDERIVVECARRGVWLLMNEANMLYPGVQAVFNQLKDGRAITLKDGAQVPIDKNFRLIITSNVDEKGQKQFAGTKPWNEAFRNRLVGFEIRPVEPEEEVNLIGHYLPELYEDTQLYNKVLTWAEQINREVYNRSVETSIRIPVDWRKIRLLTYEIIHLAGNSSSINEFWQKLQKMYMSLTDSEQKHLIAVLPRILRNDLDLL